MENIRDNNMEEFEKIQSIKNNLPKSSFVNKTSADILYNNDVIYRLLVFPLIMISNMINISLGKNYNKYGLSDESAKNEMIFLRNILPIIARDLNYDLHIDDNNQFDMKTFKILNDLQLILTGGNTFRFRYIVLSSIYTSQTLQFLVKNMISDESNFEYLMDLLNVELNPKNTQSIIYKINDMNAGDAVFGWVLNFGINYLHHSKIIKFSSW